MLTGFYVPKGGLEPPLDLSQTGFWVQRVYQFRHFGVSCIKYIKEWYAKQVFFFWTHFDFARIFG